MKFIGTPFLNVLQMAVFMLVLVMLRDGSVE